MVGGEAGNALNKLYVWLDRSAKSFVLGWKNDKRVKPGKEHVQKCSKI